MVAEEGCRSCFDPFHPEAPAGGAPLAPGLKLSQARGWVSLTNPNVPLANSGNGVGLVKVKIDLC